MLLHLAGIHPNGQSVRAQRRVQDGVEVHVGQYDGGADGGPGVQAGAAVAVAAGACRGGVRDACVFCLFCWFFPLWVGRSWAVPPTSAAKYSNKVNTAR